MHEKEPFSGSEVSQDNLSLRKGSSFARTTPDPVHAVNDTSAPEITFYNKKTRVSQFVCEIGRMMEKKKEGQRFGDKLAQRQTQAKFRLTRRKKK